MPMLRMMTGRWLTMRPEVGEKLDAGLAGGSHALNSLFCKMKTGWLL